MNNFIMFFNSFILFPLLLATFTFLAFKFYKSLVKRAIDKHKYEIYKISMDDKYLQ